MGNINKEKEAGVPQSVLHELFDYDRLTGSWTNKVHRGTTARKGQVAGCLDKKGYVVIRVNGHSYYAHRLAWTYIYGDYPVGEKPFIDYINGNKSDNRIENLKCSSGAENQRNQKMTSRNTSGINGVQRKGFRNNSKKNPKITYYWVAYWCSENGKVRSKSFNIEKLGEVLARQSAIDYREEQLRLLEVNFGIIYSERHGTESNING